MRTRCRGIENHPTSDGPYPRLASPAASQLAHRLSEATCRTHVLSSIRWSVCSQHRSRLRPRAHGVTGASTWPRLRSPTPKANNLQYGWTSQTNTTNEAHRPPKRRRRPPRHNRVRIRHPRLPQHLPQRVTPGSADLSITGWGARHPAGAESESPPPTTYARRLEVGRPVGEARSAELLLGVACRGGVDVSIQDAAFRAQSGQLLGPSRWLLATSCMASLTR
jgi:hypothetical protein